MPKSCAVIGCNASARMPERKFFRFPMLNHSSPKALTLTKARQDSWIAALNRADFFPKNYKNATVCDIHFISGKSARYTEIENVDWVPSLNLGYKIIKNEPTEQEDCREQFELNEPGQFSQVYVTEELYSDDEPTEERQSQFNLSMFSVGSQTDDRITGMSNDIIAAYQEKITSLEEMLSNNTNNITPT